MRRPFGGHPALPPRAADESMEEKVHDGSKIRRCCPSIRKCLSVGLLSLSRNSIYSVCFKGPDLCLGGWSDDEDNQNVHLKPCPFPGRAQRRYVCEYHM